MGGNGGAPAPCVFQRLRQVGQELDGELAQLVPPAGLTSAQTNAVIPFRDRTFPPALPVLKAVIPPAPVSSRKVDSGRQMELVEN